MVAGPCGVGGAYPMRTVEERTQRLAAEANADAAHQAGDKKVRHMRHFLTHPYSFTCYDGEGLP